MDESRWLDEGWCEGAAVLDFDEQVLLFCGGEDIMGDIPLHSAHLSLMREPWPGWRIRWAHGGIVAIGFHVGEPARRFRIDREPDPRERFHIGSDGLGENRVLLTVSTDGAGSARRVAGDGESLCLGPDALDVLDEVAGAGRLVWQGQVPTGGAHVDFDNKALVFWWAQPTPAIAGRFAAAWPGRKISWIEDRFDARIERSGLDIRLPEPPFTELRATRIESLRRCCHWAARNPARDLAAKIGAATIGTTTDQAHGSIGDAAEKPEIIGELSRRLLRRRS